MFQSFRLCFFSSGLYIKVSGKDPFTIEKRIEESIQKGEKDRKLKIKRQSKKRTPLLKIVDKVSLL